MPVVEEHWINLYCRCGHTALVSYRGPWLHRDELLARSRCKVCGKRGAADMKTALAPDRTPGSPGYRAI